MSVQNQVKGVTSLVGGKGHCLVKAKVIQQCRQTDSQRIGAVSYTHLTLPTS